MEVFLLLKIPCSNDGNMTFITYTIVKKNQTLTKCIMIAQKVHKLLLENNMNDPLYEPNVQLYSNVTIDEVACVIQKSKSGSACGYDELPYEVLKSPVIIACLQ